MSSGLDVHTCRGQGDQGWVGVMFPDDTLLKMLGSPYVTLKVDYLILFHIGRLGLKRVLQAMRKD